MKRIAVYLKEDTETQLRQEAKKQDASLSECAAQLIELGLKIKSMQHDEKQKKEEALLEKTPEYLLRILNICSEVFRCTYDNAKVLKPAKSSEEALDNIKEKVQAYIDGFTEKDTH